MRYGLERLLYRLSQSACAGRFILKGAMLFQLWTANPHRPTRGLDLLATGAPSASDIEEAFRNVRQQQVEDDGLRLLTPIQAPLSLCGLCRFAACRSGRRGCFRPWSA